MVAAAGGRGPHVAQSSGPRFSPKKAQRALPETPSHWPPPQVGGPGGGVAPGAPQVATASLSHRPASRPPGTQAGSPVARVPGPLRALLRGPRALPRPQRGGRPVLPRALPRSGAGGGSQRRRVWRPQTLPADGAPAREPREHAPGAAGALARAGDGSLGAAARQVVPTAARGSGSAVAAGACSGVGRVRGAAFVPRRFRGRRRGADGTRVTETAHEARLSRGFEHSRSVTQVLRRLRPLSRGLLGRVFVCFRFSVWDCCCTMFTLLLLLGQLPAATVVAFPLCARGPEEAGRAGEEGEHGFSFQKTLFHLKLERIVLQLHALDKHRSTKMFFSVICGLSAMYTN